MVRWMLTAFLVGLFFAGQAVASDQQPDSTAQEEVRAIQQQQSLSLDDLFRVAWLNNPTLSLARNQVLAEGGRARQAGLYPNPSVEFSLSDVAADDFEDRKNKISLVQPFIISGRRGSEVAAARAHQTAASHALDQARRDVFRQVHNLWAEHLYYREAAVALAELLTVAQGTHHIAQTRFEVRAAPESHLTKALLEVYELETAQNQLARQQARATAELIALLGGTELALDRLEGQAELLEPAPFDGSSGNPSLRAATSRIEAAAASLRQARSQRLPDLDVSLSYARHQITGDGFIEAGISLPLPLFNRNQGRVSESRAMVAAAEDQRRLIEGQLKVALATASARYQETRDELQASTERMVPAAERGLSQATEGYRVGKLPFLELIDAQRTYSNIKMRNLELRRDLITAQAELASLNGTGPYSDTGEDQ